MKKIITALFLTSLVLFAGYIREAAAHGAVYEQRMVGENTLRVTVKWSDSSDSRGLVIRTYSVQGGKYINIGYEAVSGKPNSDSKDFDMRSFLPPVRIRLFDINNLGEPVFPDIKGHYAEEYIHHLHDAGVVNGRPDGTFGPNNPVSRAEFVTMMVKALKLQGIAENAKGYTDIDGHWAKNTLLLAAKHNLISGYPDKTLKPDNPITLAEVSAVISRAFNFKTSKNGVYPKIRQGMWYTPYVKKMFDSGILNTEDNLYKFQFDEQANLSRANCALMISRALTTN